VRHEGVKCFEGFGAGPARRYAATVTSEAAPAASVRPPAWQRAYVAACAGATAYCLAYGTVDYLHVPRLFHYQAEHVFRLQQRAAGPAPAGYLGLWLWALVAGLVGAAVGFAVVRARKRPVSAAALALWLAWTLTAFAFVGAYFTWNNWPRS